ncbi:MAG: DUF4290 domain-containing protein [Muribaculaceae bacterium]|nr:DUF4290 domain-containing protein [Muribaculaceae bacterium]
MEKIDIHSENYKFLPYNTGMPTLPIQEYGRTIQNMVDYCVEIPDREERTACAYAIIGVMKRLFPNHVGEKGDLKKFWDHLNIMSKFELDIDFPCEVVTAETVNPKPERIAYAKGPIRYRHYGRSLESMIKTVADMEDGEERDELICMIAHQMKKLLLQHNPEGVDNARVLRDLYDYSEGKINLDPETYILRDFYEVTPVNQKKKNRKKNR